MLASEAIQRAYREAAIKPIGTIPTAEEYVEGLDRLNGFIDSLMGAEIGQLMTDVQVPQVQRTAMNPSANFNQPFPLGTTSIDQPFVMEDSAPVEYVLAPNSRILWRGTVPTTVFFPQNPGDGARVQVANTGATATLTLNGNGRRINGTDTVTRLFNDPNITYFYRADLGNWIPLATLAQADTLPLPVEFDRLIVCGTAIALTALDEINATSGTLFTYERLLKRCKERYFQRQAVTSGGQYLQPANQAHDGDLGRLW